jgi:UDP:flavonoid glycosyltransferase YjiC (YdhE family)
MPRINALRAAHGLPALARYSELPVVVVPCGRDQLDVARRVEVAAAGVRISPRRLTADRLWRQSVPQSAAARARGA